MSEHFLYIMTEGPDGPVKIGRSKNPWARIHDLQIGNPRPISVAATWRMTRNDAIEAERMLHEELDMVQLEGEWFNFDVQTIVDMVPNFLGAIGFEAERA
jgi:hypothetical protein